MKLQAACPLLFFASLLIISDPTATDAQDCVDYGETMHWLSSLRISFAQDVAVDGSIACIARGYRTGTATNGLVKIDISNP